MTAESILLALACLLCAGLNDFAFKLFARKSRPVGLYFSLIGVVWAGTFMAVAGRSLPERMNTAAAVWGVLSGLCSVTANILLVRAMKKHEGGVCATVYRLNLVPAALLAFVFLGEHVTLGKLLGIGCAAGAVLLFYQPDAAKGSGLSRAALMAVVSAALLRAGMGLFYKCGVSRGADELAILVINGWFWVAGGLLYYAGAERGTGAGFKGGVVRYGLISGALVCGIVWFMILALKHGDASVVLPISQLSFVATALLGAAFLRERLTPRTIIGLALAILCVGLFGLA